MPRTGNAVFSRRAVDALGPMLSDNGELLPLVTEVGDYFAYVCLTKLDVLDQEKSRILRTSAQEELHLGSSISRSKSSN